MTIGFYSQEFSFQTSSLWLWPMDSSSTHFPVLGDVRNLDLPDSKLLVFPKTVLTCLLIWIISFTYRSIWAFEGSRPSTHICWVVLALTSSCFIALTDVLAQTMTLTGSSSLFQQRKRLRCSGRRHSGTQAPIKNWGEDFSACTFSILRDYWERSCEQLLYTFWSHDRIQGTAIEPRTSMKHMP